MESGPSSPVGLGQSKGRDYEKLGEQAAGSEWLDTLGPRVPTYQAQAPPRVARWSGGRSAAARAACPAMAHLSWEMKQLD